MIRNELRRVSYASAPKYEVVFQGHLAEAARGEILIASVSADGVLWPSLCVVKTIDLQRQNVYAVSADLSPREKTLRGIDRMRVRYLSDSKRDAKAWAKLWMPPGKTGRVAKVSWLTKRRPKPADGATELLLCNEFLNEYIIGRIMAYLPVPHVVRTHEAWIEDGVGHILMDYGGHSLTRAAVDMTVPEIQSIVVQILVTLAIAQQAACFKHHDIHLDNVFVTRLSEQYEYKRSPSAEPLVLASKPVWRYDLPGCSIYLPHQRVLARLGDFGLSSVTDPTSGIRVERVDYPLLEDKAEWGEWSGTFEGQEGYDVATMLSKFFLDASKMPPPVVAWAKALFAELQRIDPDMRVSNIGRPLRDSKCCSTPLQLLKSKAFDAFRVHTDNALKVF